MSEQLLPFPFCGGQPEEGMEFFSSKGSEITLAATVGCAKCNVWRVKRFQATDALLVPFERYIEAIEAARTKWNRRTQE